MTLNILKHIFLNQGLKLIHELTAWKKHELRIDMVNFDSTKVYAKYR